MAVTARKAGWRVSSSFLPAESELGLGVEGLGGLGALLGGERLLRPQPGERDAGGGHGGAEPLGGRGVVGGGAAGADAACRCGRARWSSGLRVMVEATGREARRPWS